MRSSGTRRVSDARRCRAASGRTSRARRASAGSSRRRSPDVIARGHGSSCRHPGGAPSGSEGEQRLLVSTPSSWRRTAPIHAAWTAARWPARHQGNFFFFRERHFTDGSVALSRPISTSCSVRAAQHARGYGRLRGFSAADAIGRGRRFREPSKSIERVIRFREPGGGRRSRARKRSSDRPAERGKCSGYPAAGGPAATHDLLDYGMKGRRRLKSAGLGVRTTSSAPR
jgi:hypothetical protein